MRHIAGTFVLVGVLALAGNAFAAAPQAAAKKTSAPASHSVKGTVKSVDDSTLVISRHNGADMTFALNASTTKEGTPAVGSDVSVKYHTEGQTMMATSLAFHPAKQVASAKPAAPASKKTAK
jgi:hypothetical protein